MSKSDAPSARTSNLDALSEPELAWITYSPSCFARNRSQSDHSGGGGKAHHFVFVRQCRDNRVKEIGIFPLGNGQNCRCSDNPTLVRDGPDQGLTDAWVHVVDESARCGGPHRGSIILLYCFCRGEADVCKRYKLDAFLEPKFRRLLSIS